MYRGAKRIIELYKEPFDREGRAIKLAKKRLREQGVSTNTKKAQELIEEEKLKVLQEWRDKADNGKKAHDFIQQRELKKYPNSHIGNYEKFEGEGDYKPLFVELEREKHYYEKYIYNDDYEIIGYIDHLYIDKKGYIHIEDWKTHSNFTRGYTYEAPNGFRIKNYYYQPISNLIDCKFTDAQLQCSLYMYMVWLLNPKLKFGKIKIIHVVLDEEGNRTGEELPYECSFLLDEIKTLLRDYKKNKQNELSI